MDTFKKLKNFYMPYKRLFITSMFFLIIVTAITIIYPIILQLTIDEVIYDKKYEMIQYLSIGFVILILVREFETFIQQY
ncbi:hypothetical protein B5V91_18470, partial [Heyndrickxia sporothermodurans]